MSGETLEDYFRNLNLDENRRKFLESMKDGKQQDKELEERYFKNGNREDFTPVISTKYSIYIKRFAVHQHPYGTLGNRPIA